MNEKLINQTTNDTVSSAHHTLPSPQNWRIFESNRLLLDSRKRIMAVIFKVIAVAALIYHTPFILVALWASVIMVIDIWMRRLTFGYQSILKSNPNLTVMTADLSQKVQKFKIAWLLNCAVWSVLILLAQIWTPAPIRLICVVILNSVMYATVARCYFDKVLMQRSIAIHVILQLLFVAQKLVFQANDPDVPMQVGIYALYLLLMSYLLLSMGNRFYHIQVKWLDSEYAKLLLIDSLTKSQTQLNLEQQALVASNKLVQQFYSGAAHDLRQPVYAMQLYTSMLLNDPHLDKVLLPKIEQSCISINDMFNTLFDYQQTHMNDTELVSKDINIQETFKSLALHFQPTAAGKGLQIRFKPMEGTITMVPLYLARILSNLITNALRYTNTGGVLVAARKTREGIRFEIWDTGIGIEETKTQQIFNEFYKINKIDVENEGLGLGLAIARQLCARVPNALITVQSRVGRGSVFKFTVPIYLFKPQ